MERSRHRVLRVLQQKQSISNSNTQNDDFGWEQWPMHHSQVLTEEVEDHRVN